MSLPETKICLLWAVAAAVLSGTIAAFALEPVMQVFETAGLDDLAGILTPFGLTAGLAFGLFGGAVAMWVMGVRRVAGSVFLVTSMIGMAAAVYVAMLSYDGRAQHFMLSYALASPVGALILGVPFAFLGRFVQPWRAIGLATALPTLWAVAVAAVFDADAALEVEGLAALYIGWQALFLGTFAVARRA